MLGSKVMHQVLGYSREGSELCSPRTQMDVVCHTAKRRRRTRVFPDASPLPLLGIIFD